MATDRTKIAKKMIGVLLIVSFFLVVAACGSGNSDSVNVGNGNTGSSRPDVTGAAKSTAGTPGTAGAAEVPVIATPLGLQGTTVSGKGTTQEITVDTSTAKGANETVSVQGTAVTVEKGPVTVTITTASEPNVQPGKVTADIKSIIMNYAPMSAQFTDTGPVSASFNADLMHLPPQNASIGASLASQPSPNVLAGYESAVSRIGLQIGDVAYIMNVVKTNMGDGTEIGSATVNMSISPSWVSAHGGADKVKITRYADDGSTHVLDTRLAGLDSSGNMIFTGVSPGGLSIFALVSVKAPSAAPAITPQPGSQGFSLPFTGANSMLLVPPLVVFVIVMFMRRRK